MHIQNIIQHTLLLFDIVKQDTHFYQRTSNNYILPSKIFVIRVRFSNRPPYFIRLLCCPIDIYRPDDDV